MRRATRAWLLLLLLGGGAAAALLAYESGALQPNRPAPERFPTTGIDVSHHQGAIDWGKVASSGVAFAFIKASEGRDFRDRRFEENWRGAAAAGIPAGAYHFFTFCSPGEAQARHFLATAPPSDDALPPVADVEFVGNCTSWRDPAAVRAQLGVFLALVEAAWGVKPILYTTADALERIIADDFQRHPIWIRSVLSEPPLEAYRGWAIWQFSETARVPGIAGPVDRNALRPGTSLADLRNPATKERRR